ncbi:uncharacterized protein LOC123514264 [Portunus trituberculatus]|uniref:uncharacterized protein LOC123514264 n=1 Tax=Portunus trituberculatus TaxID=210409 RepID=UPI001E1CD933|nr:uncharacterized protein LOC123514264 [Portunus trituberculatus]
MSASLGRGRGCGNVVFLPPAPASLPSAGAGARDRPTDLSTCIWFTGAPEHLYLVHFSGVCAPETLLCSSPSGGCSVREKVGSCWPPSPCDESISGRPLQKYADRGGVWSGTGPASTEGRTKPACPDNRQPAAVNWLLHWKMQTVTLHLSWRNWTLPRTSSDVTTRGVIQGGKTLPRTSCALTTLDVIQGGRTHCLAAPSMTTRSAIQGGRTHCLAVPSLTARSIL